MLSDNNVKKGLQPAESTSEERSISFGSLCALSKTGAMKRRSNQASVKAEFLNSSNVKQATSAILQMVSWRFIIKK
jgi:hypothetical protein